MFKLVQKSDPNDHYETPRPSFLLGRSQKCEIVIDDPHISRVQAEVQVKNEKYYIKNMGRNPIRVNGRPTAGQLLNDGDEITFGIKSYRLQIQDYGEKAATPPSSEGKTMVLTLPKEETLGPRLICTTPAGQSNIVALDKPKLILGRSDEADVKLNDPSVSRQHCLIEKRKEGFFARNISATNPLLVNGCQISQKRLYNGDRINVGTMSIAFVSDHSGDAGLLEENINIATGKSGASFWLAALLVLLLGGYLLYWQAYTPWKANQALESVSERIKAGDYEPAQKALQVILLGELSPEKSRRALKMLAQTALAITQQKAQDENVEAAKKYLKTYLAKFGAGQEAEVLWDRLDYYRLIIGKRLERSQNYQPALNQFSAIRDNSLYYEEAQKAIRSIWLALQEQHRREQAASVEQSSREQALVQLIKEAETHFLARRYLTPVNQNAYAVYQAVLSIDPQHQLAHQRIDQIKTFYREQGEKYYKKGLWAKALTYFDRYRIIDPGTRDIKEKTLICREKSEAAAMTKNKQVKKGAAKNETKKREEIKRLLEESGTESSWIMQYLFEDQSGEKKSETPWSE